jgi:hypothetical protein
MLLVVVAALLVVLVTLTIIKTLAWITGILIIVAGLGLLYGVFRLGRRSRRRSRDRI